ncbi:hypothetical protein AtubIFM54640_011224 [Aspergillus tubingensis]|nr:hypothetical protein AtubIFM54640_011224 [Aspergillus tubingensis]
MDDRGLVPSRFYQRPFRVIVNNQSTSLNDFWRQEHYDIGSDQEPFYHNRWVDENNLPGFRAFMKDSLQKLEQLHKAVLDALLLGLEVDPSEADYFRSLHAGPQK